MFRNRVIVLLAAWCSIIYIATADVTRTEDTKADDAKTDDVKCSSQVLENITDSTEASVIITLLNNAGNLINDAKKHTTLGTRIKKDQTEKPSDCHEILIKNKNAKSGVYKVWPRSRIMKGSTNVYCDMDDDGGAWTVIQRRGDFDSGKEYFFQDWAAYKIGFGSLQKDFWLGNDYIFALTNQRANSVKFVLSDFEGNTTYATYDEFWIDDEAHNYVLHAKGYRGTAGDSFSVHNGHPFTTKDRDNDLYNQNCAVSYKGAWWYVVTCHASNLNGLYLRGMHESHADGVEWYSFRGHKYSLKDTAIKIRPKNFDDLKTELVQ